MPVRFIITGKDFKLTPSIKEYVLSHAAKFERYRKDIRQVKFELDVDRRHRSGENFRVEAWALGDGPMLAAGGRGETMQAAIDGVVEKLSAQLHKTKERRLTRRRPVS